MVIGLQVSGPGPDPRAIVLKENGPRAIVLKGKGAVLGRWGHLAHQADLPVPMATGLPISGGIGLRKEIALPKGSGTDLGLVLVLEGPAGLLGPTVIVLRVSGTDLGRQADPGVLAPVTGLAQVVPVVQATVQGLAARVTDLVPAARAMAQGPAVQAMALARAVRAVRLLST